MRIALCRTGTVLYEDNHGASPTAGNQDALGVLRYLKQSGHDVCLFGPAPYGLNGKTLCGAGTFSGIPSFGVDFAGTPYETTEAEEYVFRINIALTELKQWCPDVVVNVAGQQPSHSNPCNPWGMSPLRTAITTNLPCLKACEDLHLRRVVIINDPRNLPREHENHYWPYTLPAAVLSQRSRVNYWETRERKMRREEVYAACENWWTFGMPLAPLDEPRQGVVVIAHGHFHDLRVYGPERAKTWDAVLGRCRSAYEVYGHGWCYCATCQPTKNFASPVEADQHQVATGHVVVRNNPHWKGCVKHDEVQGILQRASQGPMIALEAGFATGKLREYVVAGALPRPVSFGRFHYDRDNRYLCHNHPARISQFEDWGEIPWSEAKGYVEELREKSTPNFDPLEQALAGKGEWGGYQWTF